MKWLLKALSSSVGKKFVMGITGLLLCGFLVVHLAGNLLMFAGAETYDHYAHTLHSNPFLKIAETGLFALFFVHILLAFRVTRENRAARPDQYKRKQSKQTDVVSAVPTSTWMLVSGLFVLGFLVLHIVDMKMEKRPDLAYTKPAVVAAEGAEAAGDEPAISAAETEMVDKSPYEKAETVLTNPISMTGYTVGVLFLGFHLSHGFSSAFQSLGWNHPKYNRCIKLCGIGFAVLIAIGFASLPILIGLLRLTN